jgi:hypothetical protein
MMAFKKLGVLPLSVISRWGWFVILTDLEHVDDGTQYRGDQQYMQDVGQSHNESLPSGIVIGFHSAPFPSLRLRGNDPAPARVLTIYLAVVVAFKCAGYRLNIHPCFFGSAYAAMVQKNGRSMLHIGRPFNKSTGLCLRP